MVSDKCACLYGEIFADEADLRAHVQQWLDEVANVRVHGTTGCAPAERFAAEERAHLRAYLTPACVGAPATNRSGARSTRPG